MSKSVELLLTENVENLGIVGDVVTVRSGYARNFLLPHGLGVRPTNNARQALAEKRAQVERELTALRAELEDMNQKLQDFEVTIERSCNDHGHLYGSVTQHDIVVALQAEGFNKVRDRHIRIGTAIKRVDSYQVPVQLDDDLKAEIKLWVIADRPLDFERDEMEFDNEGNLIERPAEHVNETVENNES